MLISTLDYSSYLGRLGIGRIERGRVKVGDPVALLPLGVPGPVPEEEVKEQSRITKLSTFDGLHRVDVNEAAAGDIVASRASRAIEIGKTLTDPGHPDRLLGIAVEEPTISVDFMVNNSPFAGREGKFVTSRQVRDRLFRELEKNVALKVEETDSPDTLAVSGRGELHLAILMETMRREGYEFQVSRPRVITRDGANGERLEPYEELMIDVPEEYMGVIMEKLGPRRARADRDAEPGAGHGAAHVQDPRARALRLSLRVPDRHPGQGHDAPPLSPVRALGRAALGTEARRAGGRPRGGGGGLRPRQPAGAGPDVRVAGRPGVRGHGRGGELHARAT